MTQIQETYPINTENQIIAYGAQMQSNGRAKETITTAITRLKRLAKLADLNNPEQTKKAIATLTAKNSTKQTLARIYGEYLKYIEKQWNPPHYKKENTLPFIPTETEIDSLISAASPRIAALLQLLKETGARIGEIDFLQWKHIDQERKAITITAEKGSNSRILPLSNKALAMLNALKKTTNKVFNSYKHGLRNNYLTIRKRTAQKLQNPRINNITLHTFRHYKGTMEYHKTKDILHVQVVLGHKNIQSTMIYINLEQALYLTENDQFTCKIAHNETEAIQLIETGFDYITDIGQNKLFRKRK